MTSPQPRRLPKQKRSRERFERILETARVLIAERGNDAVSMREIAEGSGVAISSVYQYFPDKNALLWTILAVHFDQIEADWQEKVAAAGSLDALNEAARWLFEQFVEVCESDPTFLRLWISAQANTVLGEVDAAHNDRIADSYAARMAELEPGTDVSMVRRRTYLMASLGSTALRVAYGAGTEKTAVLADFRELMRRWSLPASR
ncbi:MAG: TetR/AcrR family transcriptional regulator [Pseudomonadota bacterium]